MCLCASVITDCAVPGGVNRYSCRRDDEEGLCDCSWAHRDTFIEYFLRGSSQCDKQTGYITDTAGSSVTPEQLSRY